MPIAFADPRDRREVIDLLRKNLQMFVLRHVPQASRAALLDHLAWMERQKEPLNVNAKFETKPDSGSTILTLEFSHQAVKPFRAQ